MTTDELPASLAPWAPALSRLDVELAVALGPLIRHLDRLTARHEGSAAGTGELDGYDGLRRRGIPSRLLASEWAIADAAPAEFLRRASSAELLYLAPAYRQDEQRGQIAVLVDAGPDQLGPGRLVQLAALIVLYRRAVAAGAELILGVLGDEPGSWRYGDIESLLRGWLRARRSTPAEPAQVAAWAGWLDSPADLWLLTGPRLGSAHRRTLSTEVTGWNAAGATTVRVRYRGDQVELALPRTDLAVRALRGAAFRSTGPDVVDAPSVIRFPAFPTEAGRLLARGRDATELVMVPISVSDGSAGKLRRYQLPGPVVAATFTRRTIALYRQGAMLVPFVIGTPLPVLSEIEAPLAHFGMHLDAIGTGPLAPLWWNVAGECVYLNWGGRWWTLDALEDPLPMDILGIKPGHPSAMALPEHLPGVRRWVFGSDRLEAWTTDEVRWRIAPGETSVEVGDAHVLGAINYQDRPTLVTVSKGGLIVRLAWAGGGKTLTRWSGGVVPPALHPRWPWLAVQRDDGRIEVGDFTTGRVLLTLRGGG